MVHVHCYPDSNHCLGSFEARSPCAVTEVMVHRTEVIVHGAKVIVHGHMASEMGRGFAYPYRLIRWLPFRQKGTYEEEEGSRENGRRPLRERRGPMKERRGP